MTMPFKNFLVLKFVGVPQAKCINGFSRNFQDMFTTEGSGADLGFEKYLEKVFPWQHFLRCGLGFLPAAAGYFISLNVMFLLWIFCYEIWLRYSATSFIQVTLVI